MNSLSCYFATREDDAIAATYEVSFRCNLRCSHCMNSSDNNKDESMPVDLSLQMIDELYDNNVRSLYFTGGEPLYYYGIDDLLVKAHKRGFRTRLATNGTLVKDHLQVIKDNVDFVSLSLDALGESFDRIREKPGSFKTLAEAIDLLHKENVKTVVSTVICSDNINHLAELISFSKEHHVSQMNLSFLVALGRAVNSGRTLTPEQYRNAVTKVQTLVSRNHSDSFKISVRRAEKTSETETPCFGGSKIIHISPDGTISPCSWCMKASFPHDRFYARWEPGNMEDCIKTVQSFRPFVEERKSIIGYYDCPAMAYIYNKDLYEVDPLNQIL